MARKASQPLNSEIQVFRRLRTYRQAVRHESVKNITHKLRPLVFSVPGEEVRTEVKSRDTNVADFSSYMGEASASATRGFPVVIGAKEVKDFKTVERLTGIDFPVEIGADKFVQDAPATPGSDLFGELRDA